MVKQLLSLQEMVWDMADVSPMSRDIALLLLGRLAFAMVLMGLVLAGSAGLGFAALTRPVFADPATLVLAGPTGLGCVAFAGLVLVLAGLAMVFVAGGALLLSVGALAAGAWLLWHCSGFCLGVLAAARAHL